MRTDESAASETNEQEKKNALGKVSPAPLTVPKGIHPELTNRSPNAADWVADNSGFAGENEGYYFVISGAHGTHPHRGSREDVSDAVGAIRGVIVRAVQPV